MRKRATNDRSTAKRLALAMTLGLLIVSAGCGGSEAAPEPDPRAAEVPAELRASVEAQAQPVDTFVGKVDGTDAYVAVTEKDGAVTVYVCDSESVGVWFRSTLEGSEVSATHASGAVLDATKKGDGFSGTVTIDGEAHAFTTEVASYPAGLWRGYGDVDLADLDPDSVARYGWIVLGDGSQRGAKVQQTAVSSGGTVEPDSGTSGDGTVATPTVPPPTPSDADMDACKKLASSYYAAVAGARAAPEDSLKRAMYHELGAHFLRSFWNAGCLAVFGDI